MLFDRKAKTAPSHYPRIPFHVLRFFQLVSSLIVGSIMAYFMWHLEHEHYSKPWTFIWLLTASLASVVALTFTIFLHCFTGLNPRLNIAINSALAVLWVLSWSLLTWYMSGTLTHMCDISNWNEDTGIMVCRIYKALFSFTLIGMLSTLAALILDIYVRRQQTSRGVYRLHDIDTKARPEATRGPFTDEAQSYGAGGLNAPRESAVWEDQPRPSIGPYGEQSDQAIEGKGYSVPESQFDYDTGYHGGHKA